MELNMTLKIFAFCISKVVDILHFRFYGELNTPLLCYLMFVSFPSKSQGLDRCTYITKRKRKMLQGLAFYLACCLI